MLAAFPRSWCLLGLRRAQKSQRLWFDVTLNEPFDWSWYIPYHRQGQGQGLGIECLGYFSSDVKVWCDAYIAKLNGIYQANLDKSKVELINGTGRFIGKTRTSRTSCSNWILHLFLPQGFAKFLWETRSTPRTSSSSRGRLPHHSRHPRGKLWDRQWRILWTGATAKVRWDVGT